MPVLRHKKAAKVDLPITDVEEIHKKAEECLLVLATAVNNELSTQQSLTWLDENPKARNVIMLADHNLSPAFKTIDVLNAHVGPHAYKGGLAPAVLSDGTLSFKRISPISTSKKSMLTARASWFFSFVLKVIWKRYPILSSFSLNDRQGLSISLALLGDDETAIGFKEVHRRMLLAETAFKEDKGKKRGPSTRHATAWKSTTVTQLDKRQVLIEGTRSWLPVLRQLSSKGYLDVLAGVTSVDDGGRPPDGSGAGENIEHLDVKDEDDLTRSLGSVFHWKNCFSPYFTTHAIDTAIPTLPFMRDGMKKGKNRLSRIAFEKPGVPFRLRKEKPYLMLSDSALAFEGDLLTIGNFVNAHLHKHLQKVVEERHGKADVEKVVPPLHELDMVQSTLNGLKDGAFKDHDDSGSLVTDNNLAYGDSDFHQLVPTFFWSNRNDAPTTICWRKKGGKLKYSIKTTSGGMHFQTYGLQFYCTHCSHAPKSSISNVPLAPDDHRLAQSLRSTTRFQQLHLSRLSFTNPTIECVGDPPDYNFNIRLGSIRANNCLMGIPIRPSEPSSLTDAKSRRFFSEAHLQKELVLLTKKGTAANTNSPSTDTDGVSANDSNNSTATQFLHIRTPMYVSTTEKYGNYPLGHDRFLKSPFLPYAFFRSGAGLQRLYAECIYPSVYYMASAKLGSPPMIEYGIRPRAHSDRLLGKPVSYGILMESDPETGTSRPVAPGRVYPSTAVYSSLGLTSSMTDSEVWSHITEHLTGAILTKGYKNQFPDGKSNNGPLVDYRLLKAGKDRQGFWIGGAGGASEMIGQKSPDLKRPSSLEAAILEHPQNPTSDRNLSMILAAQRQAWINIYLKIGGIVPVMEVDYTHPRSQHLDGKSMDQVVYLGCYQINMYSYLHDSIDQLQNNLQYQAQLARDSICKLPCISEEFKRFYRFRTQGHFRFYLEPILLNAGNTSREWRNLRISSTDPRRIQVLIPREISMNAALSVGDGQMAPDTVYDHWVHRDKLHVNFLKRTEEESAADLEFSDEDEEGALCVNEQLSELPRETIRSLTTEQGHTIVRCISIGVFCRLLNVNVDDNLRIRPLVDPGPDHDFQLLNFHKHFAGDHDYSFAQKVPKQDYLPRLGETVQRNVFPHPIRTYDVGTLHLIICTGGGSKRAMRNGLEWVSANVNVAADFLIHSIIIRVLGKTHALKCFCDFSRKRPRQDGDCWFLPGISELRNFLHFMTRCVEHHSGCKRKNELHDFTSGQFYHTLDEKFKSLDGLRQILSRWERDAETVINEFLQVHLHDTSQVVELKRRGTFITALMDVFIQAGCTENGERLKFVCTQVVADMDELIDGYPYGSVGDVCQGPGAKAGFSVLDDNARKNYFGAFAQYTNDQLMCVGLERSGVERDSIVVIYNKRPINNTDTEHNACKLGVFVHRLPGGGRAYSEKPRKQVPHCHPVKKSSFETGVSVVQLGIIEEIAHNAVLAFKRLVMNDQWNSPQDILGEKCWTRNMDYVPHE
jgi:hypothetical protein